MVAVATDAWSKSQLEAREALARSFAEEVAVEYGVTVDEILGRGRVAVVAYARQKLMTKLWQFGLSLSEVARLIDRDHTTVLFGVRRILGDRYAQLSPGPGRTR